MKFFSLEGVSGRTLSLIFILKIIFGTVLSLIYTYYYTDRSTADVFKYFDDSKAMFDALFRQPVDYFKMLFGIGNNTPHFDRYYNQMNHWSREFESNLYNDSHTIIRFNAFVRLFSFGYYYVHTVFICFVSLLGLTAIYKTFVPYLKNKKKELIIAVFLFPSVLFWGSGVLKEGLLFFGMGMLIYYFHKAIHEKLSIRFALWIIGSAVLLMFTKFYILVCLVPGLLANWWIAKSNNRFLVLKYVGVFSIYILLGLNIYRVLPNYDPLEILSLKQKDFINLANGGTYLINDTALVYISPENREMILTKDSTTYQVKQGTPYYYWKLTDFNEADTVFIDHSKDTAFYSIMSDNPKTGSAIIIGKLEPNLWNFIKNSPAALANSLFRPHVFETTSIFLIVAAIENFIIWSFIILSLFFFHRKTEGNSMLYFCISFVFLLFLLTGLITPVLGAIVRYKVPAIPFLLIALLMITDKEKLVQKIPFLKRFLN